MSLVLLLLFGFTVFGQEAKEEKHDHATGKEKRVVATLGADGIQRAEVTGGEYYFDPNYIIVRVNKPVELTVKKAAGYVPHNMIVNAPEAGMDFKVDLDAKKTEVVKFTPTKVGTYPMICDKKLLWFKSHKERGMEGVIDVVE
jgi:plastocyanin